MSKSTLATGVGVALALAVVAYFFFGFNPISNTSQNLMSQTSSAGASAQGSGNSVVIQDVKVGVGTEATAGTDVVVSYVGKLQNGTIFDQSSAHGGSFTFTLGAGEVIPGWEQGIQGMKVGGERILIIPPSLGYGAQTVGPIPANSTLIFDVTLKDVKSKTNSTAPFAPEGPSSN